MLRFVRDGGQTLIAVGIGAAARTFRPEELGLTPAASRFFDYPPTYQVDAWVAAGRGTFAPLFTEDLLFQWFDGGRAAGEPEFVPYGALPFSTAAGALNYAQSVFEGCKAFVVRDGGNLSMRMFRPREAALRMRLSARRLAMDPPAEALVDLFERWIPDLLVRNARSLATAAFDPSDPACHAFFEGGDPGLRIAAPPPAGYIRPVLAAWGPVLGVRPAGTYLFTTHVTPVGPYRGAMKVALSDRQRRAVPWGTGAAKAAANYAGTLNLYRDRDDAHRADPSVKYDDFLFVADDRSLEELSGANVFVATDRGGHPLLRTPRYHERAPGLDAPPSALDAELRENTFLNGVTRRTVLELAPLLGFEVEEVDRLPLSELTVEPRSRALFATGTAASIAPVTHLGSLDDLGWRALGRPPGGAPFPLRSWDDPDDPLIDRIRWLRHALLACQYGLPAEIAKLGRAPGATRDAVDRVGALSRAWAIERTVPFPA